MSYCILSCNLHIICNMQNVSMHCSPHLKTGVCSDFTPSLSPQLAHTKQRRTSAFWPYYCRREKAHRISALLWKPTCHFQRQVKWYSAREDTFNVIFPNCSLNSNTLTWISWVCSGSPKFSHDQTFANFPINSVPFLCLIPGLLERKLCQFHSEHCVEKEKTKYILNKREDASRYGRSNICIW